MMKIPAAAGGVYLILGYASSGVAAAKALKASGARVLVWDDKESSRAKAAADGFEPTDIETLDFKSLKGIVAAPGVPLTHPAPHPAILKARAAGTPVFGDVELLFSACPDAHYIGITGTNGKSTTTALITHILKAAGRNVQMGGNIGTPVMELAEMDTDGIFVLELSSFQLDLLRTNKIDVAVWLNVTPDHFDRHGDMGGYIAAKMKIVRKDAPQTLILGTDEVETQGVYALLHNRANLMIRPLSVCHEVSGGLRVTDRLVSVAGEAQPFDLSHCKTLPGPHNAQNAAAAIAACEAMGLTRAQIIAGLESFPGLAHRQQAVAEIKGVRFINDSKATNADAASKALACYDPIYWIIGGKPKVGGLKGLESFAPRVAHAFIIGQASADFAAWCAAQNMAHTLSETLDVAVQQAAAMAWKDGRKDAVVLLSPACASFDQFNSFEHRGECFTALVRNLEAGV